jgi:hypothetical protein
MACGAILDRPPPLTTRAASGDVRRASPEGAVDFAPLRFGPRRGENQRKRQEFISQSEMSGFATGW